MPVFLRSSGYKIYFWSNEKGEPGENDTKVWVLSNGSFQLAHNKGNVPSKDLSRIFAAMESYYFGFLDFWKTYFDDLKFYA